MSNIQIGDKVFDLTGLINGGMPIQVTKIEDEKITVEYFEGDEKIHKQTIVDIKVISKVK